MSARIVGISVLIALTAAVVGPVGTDTRRPAPTRTAVATPRGATTAAPGSPSRIGVPTRVAAIAGSPGGAPRNAALAAAQRTLDCWAAGSWRDPPVWAWVPSGACTAPLPRASAADFCRIHDGLRVLFVGDSLSMQNFEAAVEVGRGARHGADGDGDAAPLAHVPPIQCDSRPRTKPFVSGCNTKVVCAGRVAVGFVRNDHLTPVRRRDWRSYPENVMLHPMRHALSEWAPDVVVLNRGAHYARDNVFRAGLVDALAYVARTAPRARVVLRSTPPGHTMCGAHSRPLASPLPPSPVSRKYHWADFPQQDGIMRAVAADAGVLFVDYSTPTALRPDRHKTVSGKTMDCLHYHAGYRSPVMTWVRLGAGAVALLRGLPDASRNATS